MRPSSIHALTVLLVTAIAVPIHPQHLDCHALMLHIPVAANNYVLDIKKATTDTELAEFVDELDRWSAPKLTQRITGQVNVTASYSIYAQLCFPEREKDKHVMQILTHGGMFDHRYWDATIDRKQYSYVYAAVNAGYTVLNYDRLGNLFSAKSDPFDAVQGPTEIESPRWYSPGRIRPLLSSVRGYRTPSLRQSRTRRSQPRLADHKRLPSPIRPPILRSNPHRIHLPTQEWPRARCSLRPSPSRGFQPSTLRVLSSRLLHDGLPKHPATLFLHRNNASDPTGSTDECLAYVQSIKAPIASGAALETRGLLSGGVAKDFHGPIQHFLGEFDYLVCGGDCKGNYEDEKLVKIYPAASARETYIQPGAGHGLTLHRNASAGFGVTLDFLSRNGC
ncbi:hypothetical protein LTR95_015654 [Oleoguttula sp. CCFEE 5521]